MKRTIGIVLAVLALTLLFSTCKQPTTSVDDCIDSFMSDINSTDRSGVYKNLSSDGSMYNLVKTSAYWESFFPIASISYSLSGKSTVGDYVYATITSSDTAFGSRSIIFVMTTDSDDNAVIRSIVLDGTGIYN